MRHFKILSDGYITAIGTGPGGTEITEAEYNEIKSVISNMPKAKSGYWYRLKDDLTWEQSELTIADQEPTVEEKAAAYDILMGLEE